MSARSWLYVPGDRPERIIKAKASAADAVIIDLEDAVAADRKGIARDALGEHASGAWVRINAGREGMDDLAALADVEPDGVLIAKCDGAAWVDWVAERLADRVQIAALVESARGVAAVRMICAHPRITCCHLGEVDLLADLGATAAGADQILMPARTALVYAAAECGIDLPVGGVHLSIDDLDSLASSSATMAALGFGGRAVIHPTHCSVVNTAFTTSAADVAWATAVLADAENGSAQRAVDGSMVDEAVLRRARRLLQRAPR
jgi:citrate lyase subunit beta/citryl-CoA lyase